ncbi:HesB/IscA family protein [Methyloferula stellata]|uniref:HesB/IscA family protein n=1 Tax=Methyloferula stellata TaxID=876270 RepID=UPI0003612457|nr:iron-sulfur cluster assembly accessory protein [Methyloferula stellata]
MASRFAIMSVTEAAAARVRDLTETAGKPVLGLRVGVKNGGCAGMAYTVEFADELGPLDEVVEDKGVKLVVDPKALMFLLGTEMDYETSTVSSGFVFRNPNQVGSCGCGESVTLKPADAVSASS